MTMEMMQTVLTGVQPTDHPRANDLLEIGEDLATTLGAIERDLGVLERGYQRGHDMNADQVRDALYRLLAQRGWIRAATRQYHQVRADLGGEGYALLANDGTGLPYFDDDMSDDRVEGLE